MDALRIAPKLRVYLNENIIRNYDDNLFRQYEQLVALKEKSRQGTQDSASQEHIRNIETKLDQEKLGRQRAETLVSDFIF